MFLPLILKLSRQRRIGLLGMAVVLLPTCLGYGLAKPWGLDMLGGITGVAGAAFIVLSLLFMLRFPVVAKRAGGLESMYQLHREFALAGYVLLLVHPVAITGGEWRGLNLDGKAWGFYAGWLALVIFMASIHLTFVLRPRGYALWRSLHWLTVAGFMLMVWHLLTYQIKNWDLLPALVLDVVLLFGLLAPLIRYFVVDRGVISHHFRVAEVNRPVKGVIDLKLAPAGAPLPIRPGQFVFSRFMPGEHYEGCAHFHPFTVSSVYPDGRLRLSIKALGRCTQIMQSLEPGAEARLQGPFGHLFENTRHESQVWIAGGIGITPFLARARMIDSHGVEVKLFYLYNQEGSAAFIEELNEIARAKANFEFYPLATQGKSQIAFSVFDALLPPWDDKEYVLCGPSGLTDSLRDYLARHGVTPEHIQEERFDY